MSGVPISRTVLYFSNLKIQIVFTIIITVFHHIIHFRRDTIIAMRVILKVISKLCDNF